MQSPILSIKTLKRGDIVRHRACADSYIVDCVMGETAIAVRTMQITNPAEWLRFDQGVLELVSIARDAVEAPGG